jgi:hypothetical protein
MDAWLEEMKAWRKEMKVMQEWTDANLTEMKAELRANNKMFEVLQGTRLPDGYPPSQDESCYSWGQGQFGNPEEGEHPPLEAVTRRQVKTQQAEKT